VIAPIDHVHVKKTGTEGPLCHTGSSSTIAPAGSNVSLTGCALGTTSGGLEQGSAGNHVLWIVNPAGNPDDPGQVSTQENSTDSAGKADATVTSGPAAKDKTTTIRFCLDEFPQTSGDGQGNGICDSNEANRQPNPALQADFQINWTEAAQPIPNNDKCQKIKKKIKKIKKKIRKAKDQGQDDKVARLRKKLQDLRAAKRDAC
jgi:hypothetical protein